MARITLGYWAIRGLGQPIRLILNYVGEEFDDVRYQQGEAPECSREEWLKVKFTLGLPFPNLPYYKEGDIKITEFTAILAYLGRKHDLLGHTEKERVRNDIMVSQAKDFRTNFVKVSYHPDSKNMIVDFLKQLPARLQTFEEYLGTSPWFAGETLTISDFFMYEVLDEHQILEPSCLNNFPKLRAFTERIEGLDNIKKYLNSEKFKARPINNTQAVFK